MTISSPEERRRGLEREERERTEGSLLMVSCRGLERKWKKTWVVWMRRLAVVYLMDLYHHVPCDGRDTHHSNGHSCQDNECIVVLTS